MAFIRASMPETGKYRLLDANLDGWPCRAGDVWLSHEGRLMRCTLAADHEDQGLGIPAGTEIALAVAAADRRIDADTPGCGGSRPSS
jgi:hypothetical protein